MNGYDISKEFLTLYIAHVCNCGYSSTVMPLPSLRNLEVSPIRHKGQTLVCLRDPEGYVEEQIVLSPAAFFVASMLDGENEITDIQYRFATQSRGTLLNSEDIRKVVEFLDERGLLHTARFEAVRKRIDDDFAARPVRAAYLAGKAYPNEPHELRTFLNAMLVAQDKSGEHSPASQVRRADTVRCLIAPHIDFERGGPTYGWAYSRLAGADPPGTVFVFGVAHAGAGAAPFILTRKHFETPLGIVETDGSVVDRLAGACAWDPFRSETVHRTEHSIEFQAVMLAHLFGAAAHIVPILCGPLFEDDQLHSPAERADVRTFLEACRNEVRSCEGRALVIAGADLSHVGRRFGDAFDIDHRVRTRVEELDRQDLQRLTALDAEGFYQSVTKDGNPRHVCGHNAIYVAVHVLEDQVHDAELLHYGQAPDPAGGLVTFAAVAFS